MRAAVDAKRQRVDFMAMGGRWDRVLRYTKRVACCGFGEWRILKGKSVVARGGEEERVVGENSDGAKT